MPLSTSVSSGVSRSSLRTRRSSAAPSTAGPLPLKAVSGEPRILTLMRVMPPVSSVRSFRQPAAARSVRSIPPDAPAQKPSAHASAPSRESRIATFTPFPPGRHSSRPARLISPTRSGAVRSM